MIETSLATGLCDLREQEYETPLSHHERHLVTWVLHTLATRPDLAERFDRQRWPQGRAVFDAAARITTGVW